MVVGAGYIAVELAGILRTLGSDTSLLIRYDKVRRLWRGRSQGIRLSTPRGNNVPTRDVTGEVAACIMTRHCKGKIEGVRSRLS